MLGVNVVRERGGTFEMTSNNITPTPTTIVATDTDKHKKALLTTILKGYYTDVNIISDGFIEIGELRGDSLQVGTSWLREDFILHNIKTSELENSVNIPVYIKRAMCQPLRSTLSGRYIS